MDFICNRTNPLDAIPTEDLPFKAGTCYMLNGNDIQYSMGQHFKIYRPFNKSPNVKLNLCYRPAQASLLDTPTIKHQAVYMVSNIWQYLALWQPVSLVLTIIATRRQRRDTIVESSYPRWPKAGRGHSIQESSSGTACPWGSWCWRRDGLPVHLHSAFGLC